MNTLKPNTVLVIGDWFIDEYWFISRHHSDISSHVGQDHYRIVSEPKAAAVRDLSGAGLIARVLYELRKYRPDGYDIRRIVQETRNLKHLNLNEKNF